MYGSVNDTPDDCLDAICIRDYEEDCAAIAIKDIDTLIEELVEMKKEWETKKHFTEVPERFEFKVGSAELKYTAIDSYNKNGDIIVAWQSTSENGLSAVTYTKEEVLKYLNTKFWTIL